jgi:acid phosphatase
MRTREKGNMMERLFERILIVLLENQPQADVHSAPYLETLKAKGLFLATYFGVRHPSQPNYLAAISGSTFGIDSDDDCNLNDTTIVDLLEREGITWKAYIEDLPTSDKLTSKQGLYARKHNPFVSFTTVSGNTTRLARVVDGNEFAADRAGGSLPQFCWYTPNIRNDGHTPHSIANAGTWLKTFLEPLVADTEFMRETLVVVTFDERLPDADNHVYAVLLGPGATPGTVDTTRYDHYSILRTVEENWSLGTLGRSDQNATWFRVLWGLAPTVTTPEEHN